MRLSGIIFMGILKYLRLFQRRSQKFFEEGFANFLYEKILRRGIFRLFFSKILAN